MTIKLGSNIASLQAQRRLGEATSSLGKIYERLSSGQRINRASDDAAGIAIADELNVRGRIFSQAIRNGNDGISVLNIADSAIESLAGIVTRIRELAAQSANGTYSNTQRNALDAEAQALSKEFTRIKSSTSFNGAKLFDGALGDGLRLQLGLGIEGSINTSVGGAVGVATLASPTIYDMGIDANETTGVELADLNGDGILDIVTSSINFLGVRLGTGSGTFGQVTTYGSGGSDLALGDLNGDGFIDIVTSGSSSNVTSVLLGTGNGSFGAARTFANGTTSVSGIALGDLNGDGVLDLVTTGTSGSGAASVRLGTGTGSFGALTTYAAEGTTSSGLALGDLNGDGILDLVTVGSSAGSGRATVRLGTGTGTFGAATSFAAETTYSRSVALADLNGDNILDIVTAGASGATGVATTRFGTGNGSFGSSATYATESTSTSKVRLGDINGDGTLDLITAGTGSATGAVTLRLGSGSGTFGGSTSSVYSSQTFASGIALGDLDQDGVLDFATSGYYSIGSGTSATVIKQNTKSGISSLPGFSLKTKADSLQAMGILTNAQNNLANQRGVIGANQSRVGIAINNLMSAKENLATAESRVRSADVATDATELIRTQILQQSAVAILAQANQSPALALKLLTGI